MQFVVLGAVLLVLSPVAYRFRKNRAGQAGAGAAHTAVTGFGGGKPRTARTLALNAVIGAVLGVALIVYGLTRL